MRVFRRAVGQAWLRPAALGALLALGCTPSIGTPRPVALHKSVAPARLPRARRTALPTTGAEDPGQRGSMAVYRRGARLLLELPPSLLDKDIMAVQRVAEVRDRPGAHLRTELFPGTLVGSKIFRLTRTGRAVALRWRDRAGRYTPGPRLPVVRERANGTSVFDATAAYVGAVTVAALPSPAAIDGRPRRSTVKSAYALRDHVEFDVEHVFADRTVTMHWSLLVLPSVPMMPRYADPRFVLYTQPAPDTVRTVVTPNGERVDPTYVRRFRLEKRDPTATVSDVVKPIVFYLDPATPKRWVPWIIRGVEAWQRAFEAAGFRKAIVAREAPPLGRDTTWSLYAASHNSITWSLRAEEGAFGEPNVVDERTGEILSSHVGITGGEERVAQQSAFVLLGGTPDIPLPFPDSILGELIEMAATHEVGHAIGFGHNFKAASAYPTDSAHNASFVHRRGYSASVMDYAYYNFVAQPEDRIPFGEQRARIGEYDVFAVGWVYRPIPNAKSPVDEIPTLEAWRQAQDTAPYLRGPRATGIDPGDQMDDLGDDAIRSTDLGIRNLVRAGRRLVAMRQAFEATPQRASAVAQTVDTADTERRWVPPVNLELVDTYQVAVLRQWAVMLSQVAYVIGGAVPQLPYPRDGAAQRLVPIDSARQMTALRYLLDHVLRGRDEFVQAHIATAATPLHDVASIVRQNTLSGGWKIDEWRRAQLIAMWALLDGDRMAQLTKYSPNVLPAVCTELELARREIAAATEQAKAAGTDVARIERLGRWIVNVVGPGGICQQHGWIAPP